MKVIGDIFYTNGEVVSGCYRNIKVESRKIKDWGGVLVKIDSFYFWYIIGKMEGK